MTTTTINEITYNFETNEITQMVNGVEEVILNFKDYEALVSDLVMTAKGMIANGKYSEDQVLDLVSSNLYWHEKKDIDEEFEDEDDLEEIERIIFNEEEDAKEKKKEAAKKKKEAAKEKKDKCTIHCKYGTKCKNYPDCEYKHPRPCAWDEKCTFFRNDACRFMHLRQRPQVCLRSQSQW